jgi:alginate O-acetyltransferase complex protein AlgI
VLAGMIDVTTIMTGPPSVEAWRWIVAGLSIALFAPNSQEVLSQYDPALGVRPTAQWLTWRPNKSWTLVTATIAIYGILQISKASEFIYYQF